MEKKSLVLCDTNVIIDFYKENQIIIESLKSIGQNNIAISIITSGELIYGALNKKELVRIKEDLLHLKTFNIDQNICDLFIEMMTNYSLSHNLTVPDCFIAATAIDQNIPLFNLNKKDFKYIKGLKLWE